MTPFYLACAIDDIEAARRFYGNVNGCPVGREAGGEQRTVFVKDRAGNALEFKAYRHPGGVFAPNVLTSHRD